MANEITILNTAGTSTDGTLVNVVFRYDISSAKSFGGTNVVVSAASELPALAAQALSAPVKSALDDGTAAFAVQPFFYNASETTAENVARLRAQYDAEYTRFLTRYARTYRWAGLSIASV